MFLFQRCLHFLSLVLYYFKEVQNTRKCTVIAAILTSHYNAEKHPLWALLKVCMHMVELVQGGLILYCHTVANVCGEKLGLGELPLTAHWMWWIAHPCPVMCMHIWCWNGLSMGPLSFNHVKAKYRTEHIFCCLALLLCHSLQHNPHTQLAIEMFFILPMLFCLKIPNLICFQDASALKQW